MTTTRRAAVAATVLVVAALLVLVAGPASAHPAVTAASPPDGAVLHESPLEVSFTFGEDVEAPLGSIRVYDRTSTRVDNDDARITGADGRTVVATLPPDLPDGAYVIIWRAIGIGDGHLVLGEQHFVVGHEATGAVAAAPSDGPAVLVALSRGVGAIATTATAVTAGAALFALTLLARRDQRWRAARGAVTRLVRHAAVVAGAASLLLLATETVVRAAALDAPVDAAAVAATVTGPIGTAAVARALLLLPLGSRLLLGNRWFVLLVTWLAVASLAVDGHTTGLALVAAMVHVGTAVVWAGGLIALAVALRRAPSSDALGRTTLLGEFSLVATVGVLVAGAAGGVLAVVTAEGTLPAVAASPWGQAMRAKGLVVAAALLVAAHTRWVLLPRVRADVRLVPQGGAAADPAAVLVHSAVPVSLATRVARNVTAEAALVAVVLLLSGTLSTLDPAAGARGVPAPAEDGAGTEDCVTAASTDLAHDCFPSLPDLRDSV